MDLDTYRAGRAALPARMLRWHLYGAGLENLGRNGKPEEVAVPSYAPNELLVRQDACGLCFSDTKVIGLGKDHPRMTGRDLASDPVTLGHEVSCTVVGVGDQVGDRFHVGERYVIQADVFYGGKSMAYGYAIPGGLAEYSVIPQAVIDGDEGCYLLPIRPDTGYVESALTEPWACVVSAYAQAHRDGVKHGGLMLVIGDGLDETRRIDWSGMFSAERKPRLVVTLDLSEPSEAGLLAEAGRLSIPVESIDGNSDHLSLLNETVAEGVDDLVIVGAVSPQAIEHAAGRLANHAILSVVTDQPLARKLSLDVGRVHYNWHYYLGTTSNRPADAYQEKRSADLLPGGSAWFIGAGGPMGQMHVQRAVMHRTPPKLIVATDVDAPRLQSVADRFGKIAAERGIELVTLNPRELGDVKFDEELRRLSDGKGFDDIICMVPVPALIEHAANYLADGAWFNVFAGVARGTMASLDINNIVQRGVRFLGSSGSSLSDMRETLSRVESDELSTNASLAAVGGMSAVKDGLQAVKEGWFPGKTLIFPLIHDLPLTPLPALKEKLPSVYALLRDGQFWTQAAEDELLRIAITEESSR